VNAGPPSEGALGADAVALGRAWADVGRRVSDACDRVGRDPGSVSVVAVTKTVPPERLRLAVAVGIDLLGENRVQEAAAKVDLVPGARWHLVGPLQANKARRALEVFDVIETVDSIDLAGRLDRLAGELHPGQRYPVLVQVNVDVDPTKAGYEADNLESDLDELLALPNLTMTGLMTVGRQVPTAEAARPTFRALRELSERLRRRWPRLGTELSMGMTDDFEVAIGEGATIVRIGRAIFGERPK
jgi:hypothetical protein